MQLNQLVPEKDWVAKVNENFTKLSAGVQKTTALVGKNGWVLNSKSYAMEFPGLNEPIKLLHIEATNTSITPGQTAEMVTVPEDFGAKHALGYINYPADESGHDGGFLSMYFVGSTLNCNLKAMDGHTNPHNLSFNFTLMYI